MSASGPFDLSWWCEVFRRDHQLPPRWPLNEHLVARSSAWRSRARVTREGIAFHSHPLGFISSSQRLDQVVDKPRLRYLDAKATFEVLATEANLELAESPAGRFTTETIQLWGGLTPLTTALRQPLVRSVLDAYLSHEPSGNTPGNLLAGRRYLSLGDLQAAAAGHDGLTPFLDDSLHKNILRRGLSLYCNRCTHFGWYDADDIGPGFRCWRCRAMNTIDSTVVRGGGTEPNWYYALAEVVYQANSHNFNVPLLTLSQVSEGAHSVLGMTDHEVVFPTTGPDGKPDKVEIDLWGIIDGRIILGEAKSNSRLEGTKNERNKKAAMLRRAADALTADTLVLATAQPEWTPSALEAIEQAFTGARCTVDARTNVDPYLASGDR